MPTIFCLYHLVTCVFVLFTVRVDSMYATNPDRHMHWLRYVMSKLVFDCICLFQTAITDVTTTGLLGVLESELPGQGVPENVPPCATKR